MQLLAPDAPGDIGSAIARGDLVVGLARSEGAAEVPRTRGVGTVLGDPPGS